MITVNETGDLFVLETQNSIYIIGLLEGMPIHLYWGSTIDPLNLTGFVKNEHHSSFDRNVLLERAEYPVWDARTYGLACLQADTPLFFRFDSWYVAGENLTLTLKEERIGHYLLLKYRLLPEYDVIVKQAELVCGSKALSLKRFLSAAWCTPFAEGKWKLEYCAGAWGKEFQLRSTIIQEGTFSICSTRGLSGPHFNPAVMLVSEEGQAYATLFAWSGSWQINASKTIFGNYQISAGWNDQNFNAQLTAGGRLVTPESYLCFDQRGTAALSRKLHDFQRLVLSSSTSTRHVLYNSWEATCFDVHASEQMRLADRARDIGIEMFVVDDGWFGERKNDTAGLGDWQVNTEKFPKGLDELICYVKNLGMRFGLWVEPESVSPDSELYRKHPDWIYRLDELEPLQLRNQYVLNFGLPQVEEFARNMLYNLLKTHDISYLKWDMNRPFSDIEEGIQPFALEQHVLTVYRILDSLRLDFPNVDIEACSGGGARVDLGMIQHTAQFWPSDNTDPFDRLTIQKGCAKFYAPAMTSCWVTDTPKQSGRAGRDSLDYKFNVAMSGGSLGIGADISAFSDEEMQLSRDLVTYYKTIRHLIMNGDYYAIGDPHYNAYSAVLYVAKNKSEACLFAFYNSFCASPLFHRLHIQGLDPRSNYYCEENGELYSAQTLMNWGLDLRMMGDFQSLHRHFVRI